MATPPPWQPAAVLFDLDGTLVDSAPDLAAAADALRTRRGLPSLPFEAYRPVAGAGARGLLGVAFGVSPDDADFDSLKQEFFAAYQDRLTRLTHPFAGVAELIENLHHCGIPWGVVTNKSERFAKPLTQALPLFATCRVLIGGDTTAHAKPHPFPLLEAARRLHIDPSRCLYVGDDERDIQAGQAAGMRTVAAHYGYLGSAPSVQDWGADHHIHHPLDLLQLLNFAGSASQQGLNAGAAP